MLRNELGLLLKAAGEYQHAREQYELALRQLLAQPGAGDSDEAATLLHNLAGIRFVLGDPAGAARCARRGLAMRRRLWGPDDLAVPLDEGNLAPILIALGDYDAAQRLLDRLLAEFTARLANRDPVMHYGRMPVVEATVVVAVPADVAFAVSQTTGETRYRWDSFVRRQYFLDGATQPAKGVRTFTRSRHGLSMISEYVSYAPPTNVGMKMVRGPWFLEMMAGGWRFAPAGDPDHTVATWRYHFRTRPALIRPIADRIGIWLLGRDIRRRILGYAQGCQDPSVLASIQVDNHPP